MAPAIILAVLTSAIAIWAVARLEPLHPAQLWVFPWALAIDLYALRLLPYRALSWTTVLLTLSATGAFVSASVLVASRGDGATERDDCHAKAVGIRLAASACAVIAMVLLALFIVQAVARFGVHGALIAPTPLRIGIAKAEFRVTIKYVYFAIAAAVLAAAVAGGTGQGRGRWKWALIAAVAVASTYFATGRATIVDAAIAAAVSFALARSTLPRRRTFVLGIGCVAVLALVVFLFGGAAIGKTYANNPYFRVVPNVFARHGWLHAFALPYEYASAPIAALQVQVMHASQWGDGHGCAALHELCVGLQRLGVGVPAISRVRPFTAPPLPWNTFTALDIPLIDVGTILTVPVIAGLGALIGWVWARARQGAFGGRLVYSIEAVALVTSAGSFNFLSTFVIGAIVVGAAATWGAGAWVRRGLSLPSWHRVSRKASPPAGAE